MNKAAKYGLAFMLILFFGIFAFVGGSTYFRELHYAEIAKTGTEAVAIVDDAEGWSEEGKHAEWWAILFHYTDSEGGYHEGKTSEAYTYSEAYDLVYNEEQMLIKYNDKFEAVAADFKYDHDFGMMTAFFYVGIAGVVGGLVVLVVAVLQTKKENEIKKNGNLATATFVEKTCNTFVNGSPRYRITYKFNASEEGGEERTVKSRELFPLDEAVYYESNKQFDVRYKGKVAVIAEKPYSKPANTNVVKTLDNASLKSENTEGACEEHNNCDFDANATKNADLTISGTDDENVLCEHCAAHLSPKDKHCPNCGAKVSKKK